MTDSLAYHYNPGWEQATRRWEAFWDKADTDRPCLSVFAPRPNGCEIALPIVASIRDTWMDPDYQLAKTVAYLEATYHGGEAVPCNRGIMAGSTLGCGDRLDFAEGGISIRPSMSSIEGPLNWHPGPDDPWRPKVDAIMHRLLDEAKGRYIVSGPNGMFRHIDLLNMLRGNSEIMVDMALNPEACRARLAEIREMTVDNMEHYRNLIDARQPNGGYMSWTGIWSAKPFLCT